MKKTIIIILLISIVALLGIGFLMTANETNINNFKNITLADGTTLGIPADFTVKKPFSNYTENDGFYYTNCDLESKDYGWIHIEYTHDPVEPMMHSSNSTKAIDPEHDGIYEFDVFDSDGHRVMKITGSNPTVVKAIGETVKFNNNKTTTNNNTTDVTTTIKEETTNQQNNNNNNHAQSVSNDNPKDLPKTESEIQNEYESKGHGYEGSIAQSQGISESEYWDGIYNHQ